MRRTGPLPSLPVALLLFGSGLSALVYQIAWQREFRLIFGSSTAASAAVLTIFIGGMGAGGLYLGKRADAHPRPLFFYARLELLIAALAAITPPLFDLARAAYVHVGGASTVGSFAGTVIRLALAALILAAPTALMGGTLPAAVRAASPDGDVGRRAVGLLYGANTIGAVMGCLVGTFFLLERLGTRSSLWSACALNAAVALLAALLSRGHERAIVRPADPRSREARRRSSAFILTAAGVVGFAFFLMELVWYRMLGPLLGGSVFTFGLILAVALFGIGLGGLSYGLFGGRKKAVIRGFALTCLLEALAIAIPFALGDRIAVLALALRPAAGGALSAYLPGWIAVTSIAVLPAAFIAGAQYPLLIALLGEGGDDIGASVGATAASNTLGAMAGSLLGGFVLLPALTATGCWRAVTGLLLVLGAYSLVRAARSEVVAPKSDDLEASRARFTPSPRRWLKRLVGPAIALLALLAALARGPTAAWRHSPIGVGRVERDILATPNKTRAWMNDMRRAIAWEVEGTESTVAVDSTDGIAMVVNGKVDGNARGDAATQVMGGLLGAFLHPRPTSAMVIGLGTGSTAGWLGAVPSIERVDVAELEPSMLRIARECAPVNEGVLDNKKVRVLLGDARETLLTIPSRYDVIFSEPSNPYRAGVASLFTREYYSAVRARLAEGGLFLQWVQIYEIDVETVRAIYATLLAVFPEVETYYLGTSDLVLVASTKPLAHDADALRARAIEEPYRRALASAWRAEGLEGVLAHYIANPASAPKLASGGVVNTDDKNHVEFAFARNVGNFARVDALVEEARARGEDRPVIAGKVDWSLVQEERIMQTAAEGTEPEIRKGMPVDMEVRAEAAVNYVAGNLSGALSKWRFQDRAPSGVTEISIVAEGLAEAGDDAALPLIDRLRRFQPVEASAVLARLRLRQGKRDEAIAALERAFIAFRADPWPSSAVMRRALELAGEVAEGNDAASARLLEAIREPFSVLSVEAARRRIELWITDQTSDRRGCAAAWGRFEPDVLWDIESLRSRQSCYEKAGDDRRRAALLDAARFAACEASPRWLWCL